MFQERALSASLGTTHELRISFVASDSANHMSPSLTSPASSPPLLASASPVGPSLSMIANNKGRRSVKRRLVGDTPMASTEAITSPVAPITPQQPLAPRRPAQARTPKAVYKICEGTPTLHPEMKYAVFQEVANPQCYPIHVSSPQDRSLPPRVTRCEFNVANGSFGTAKFVVFYPSCWRCEVTVVRKATALVPQPGLQALVSSSSRAVNSHDRLLQLKSNNNNNNSVPTVPHSGAGGPVLVRKYTVAPFELTPQRVL